MVDPVELKNIKIYMKRLNTPKFALIEFLLNCVIYLSVDFYTHYCIKKR